MIFEFKDHFSLKFIFTSDFPYEPPKISFFAGNEYPFLFDSYGDIKLDILKRENWSPTFWISTLIIHIEKEIYEKTNIFNKPNNVDNSIDKIKKILSHIEQSNILANELVNDIFPKYSGGYSFGVPTHELSKSKICGNHGRSLAYKP